jgi:hypothetical protein
VRKPSSNVRKKETSVVESANKNVKSVRDCEISRGRSGTKSVTGIVIGTEAGTHETGTEAMIETEIETAIVTMTDTGMIATRRNWLFLQS